MKMHKQTMVKNSFYLASIFLLLILFIFIYSHNTSTSAFVASDETINYAFSLLYAKSGNLYYEEELNSVARDIIRPRGILIKEGKLVPSKFIGLPLYYGTLIVIIGDAFLFYLTQVLVIMSFPSIYLLGKELFGKKNGLMSSLLLLILPPYWYWSNFPLFENLFATLFFILGLFYFIKALKIKSLTNYLLTALFMGTSWNIRPDITLFLIPLFLLLILNIKKNDLKRLGAASIIFLIVILPILYFNNLLYGGYLLSGASAQSDDSLPSAGLFWQENWIHVLSINLINLFNVIPLFSFLLFSFIICFFKKKYQESNVKKKYAIFLISSFLIFSLFYLSGFPPKNSGGLLESYTRYFLPIYLVSIPMFSLLIQHLKRFGWKKVIPALFILIFVINSSIYTVSSMKEKWDVIDSYNLKKNYIIENTEPNSVIFIWGLDKIIYPDRKVATINYLPEENREKILADISINILKKNIPLYVFDYGDFDIKLFLKELKKLNLRLIIIDNGPLYRIVPT